MFKTCKDEDIPAQYFSYLKIEQIIKLNESHYILPPRFYFHEAIAIKLMHCSLQGKPFSGVSIGKGVGGRTDPFGPYLHVPLQ